MTMAKTTSQRSNTDPRGVLHWLTDAQDEMVARVREMVLRESPTHDKPACDALCTYLAGEFERLGGHARIHCQPSAGNHLQVNFTGGRGRKPVLLLGHFDTVYDLGTLQTMPCHERKGRLYGPGVFDMKSGIAQMMFALAALREVRGGLLAPSTCCWFPTRKGAAIARGRSPRGQRASVPRCWCASPPALEAR